VISRVIVIVLALGAAAYRFSTGAILESVGLLCLGAGLILLRAGDRRPDLRRFAYLSFLATAVIVGYVMYRNSR